MTLDLWFLQLINRPGRPWLDALMVAFSSRILLFGFAGGALLHLAFRHRKAMLVAVLLAGSSGSADLIGARLVKPWAARTRPCHDVAGVVAIAGCGSNGSMPSNHAATVAAGAAILIWASPAAGLLVGMPLLCMVCLSRVYLGVHYPSDVLAGAGLGTALGALFVLLAASLEKMRRERSL